MTSPYSAPPTLTGFIAWSRDVMGLTTIVIPDNSSSYAVAYQIALDLVPLDFASMAPDIYTLTVYNFGGSQLLQMAPDQPGQTFFAETRKAYGINSFVAGVIESASDVSTSESLAIGQGLKNLQMIDLQRLKDPYGRQALAWMQTIGTLWGLT